VQDSIATAYVASICGTACRFYSVDGTTRLTINM
ncbi:unnamed protein product, partial [marine sediment metagenome]